jgi:hypothetical protein
LIIAECDNEAVSPTLFSSSLKKVELKKEIEQGKKEKESEFEEGIQQTAIM